MKLVIRPKNMSRVIFIYDIKKHCQILCNKRYNGGANSHFRLRGGVNIASVCIFIEITNVSKCLFLNNNFQTKLIEEDTFED